MLLSTCGQKQYYARVDKSYIMSFTDGGSMIRELGCAAVADCTLIFSATWMLEMPQEAQHVNPMLNSQKQLHWGEQTPHCPWIGPCASRREEELPHTALCMPQALPQTAVLSSLTGWMVCCPAPSLEEFGSCMALVFGSSFWIGVSNTGLSFIPTCASIHGLLGDWEYPQKDNEATLIWGPSFVSSTVKS